jgi:Tol biopolymer transport system component
MSPDEFRHIQSVFSEATNRPESDRPAYVKQACQGNTRLQASVEDFLRLSNETGPFLDAPLAETLGLTLPGSCTGAALSPGTLLENRFLIQSVLEGSWRSPVYLAKDTRLYGKLVIVKIVHQARTEAQALSALNHPSVAGILESGELENGDVFVVVEHVAGKSLRNLLRDGALPQDRALRIIRQLAATIGGAHKQGIWHLDLKPENVILSDEGTAEERVNLLDFGMARIVGVDSSLYGGSPGYMAPEQAQGMPEARSDIYSMGIMLFEMLTGKLPSAAVTRSSIPKRIRKAIAGAAAERPEDRFASCWEFIRALDDSPVRIDRLKAVVLAAVAGLCTMVAAVLFPAVPRAQPPIEARPVPIAASPGRVHWLTLSPDGEKLYYAAGSRFFEYMDIYVKDLRTGATRALTTDGKFKALVSCSPDGKLIGFFRDRGMDRLTMVIMPASGGPERELFTGYVWSVQWGADSSTLLMSYRTESEMWPHLRGFNISDSSWWDITGPPKEGRGDRYPAVSPDGRTVSFVRHESRESSDIFLLPVNTRLRPAGTPRRLTSRRVRTLDPQWTAGGKELIFSSGPLNHYKLYRVAADGRSEPREISEAGENVDSPSLAPKAGKIAFIEPKDESHIWRLDLASPTGPVTRRTRIAPARTTEVEAVFSPDGKSIAFVSKLSGEQQVWIAGADGSNPRQVTSEAPVDGIYPVWLPDSSGLIASVRAKAFGVRNFLFQPPAGPGHEIPALEGKALRFSRDGKWLYFSSMKTGDIEIFKYDVQTREIRQVTHDSRAAHAVESPDGKTIYFSKPEAERGLWKIPATGGKPARVLPSLVLRTLFDAGREGIYYMAMEPRQVVLRLRRFADGKDYELQRLEPDAIPAWGLSLSPDERSILYSQYGVENAKVAIIEGFR